MNSNMPGQLPAELFEGSITQKGRRVGLYLPTFSIVICVLVQLIFTNFFSTTNKQALLVVLASLSILVLFDELHKQPSILWRRIHWTLVHMAALYAIAFLLPLPSPYILAVMLLATLTYAELGLGALFYSLATSTGLLFGRYVGVYGLTNHDKDGLFFVT